MKAIFDNLYQFTSYIPLIDLTFHQYLIDIDEPVLVHTGNKKQAEAIIPQIKEVLGNKELKYIFVSHFEADECGGVGLILKEYPSAKVIASEVTARQLDGFGLVSDVLVKEAKSTLRIEDTDFKFIGYPSEMHLWEGLLLFDLKRGTLFSSDLMIRFGNSGGKVLESTLDKELDRITKDQVPDKEKREKLIDDLKKEDIKFIATGHGECIRVV